MFQNPDLEGLTEVLAKIKRGSMAMTIRRSSLEALRISLAFQSDGRCHLFGRGRACHCWRGQPVFVHPLRIFLFYSNFATVSRSFPACGQQRWRRSLIITGKRPRPFAQTAGPACCRRIIDARSSARRDAWSGRCRAAAAGRSADPDPRPFPSTERSSRWCGPPQTAR